MIINLTPHVIKVMTGVDTTTDFPPSGNVARVAIYNIPVDPVDGIPVYTAISGDPIDVPDPVDGTYYVVSTIVRLAMPDRKDLLSPGQLIRDDNGQPVGCAGFVRN